jgi:molybdenum cofactor biosynthesis enzyme MoaA
VTYLEAKFYFLAQPLVRKDIIEIAQDLGSLKGLKTLGITTNGLLLVKKLPALQAAGVNAFNISLDTLVPGKFTFITRRLGFDRVLDSIHKAVDAKAGLIKVNVVVMKGVNDDELGSFVALTRDMPIDVRFIEYMPFDGNKWSEGKFLPYAAQLDLIKRQFPSVHSLCNDVNDTSKGWKVPGYEGVFGFITSMTSHFCGGCNRLRLTADGNIKVCLFDNKEVSLRDAMRGGASDEELSVIIAAAVGKKKRALGGHKDRFELAQSMNRSMIRIGG